LREWGIVTIPELLVQYESRMSELQTGLEHARLHGGVAAAALAIAFGLFLMLGASAVRQRISFVWPPLPLPLIAIAARRYQRFERSRSHAHRLRRYYLRAVRRVKGNWAGSGLHGDEFVSSGHMYARDLNIVGEGSLFELLCTARTAIGQRGLAQYLGETSSLDEALSRQDAIKELREQLDLRERIALLGEFEVFESKFETFSQWLDLPAEFFGLPIRIAAFLSSVMLATAFVIGIAGLATWTTVAVWAAPLVAFHTVVGLQFRARVNRMLPWLRSVSIETQVLREGLRLLEEQEFRCTKLCNLTARVRGGAKAVRRLERLLNALDERNKEWFYSPSLLLLAGSQLYMAIEQWRAEHRTAFGVWLEAWAEFEALNALANYAYENPENTFPEFSNTETGFEAEGLAHPMLPGDGRVRNDVQLNSGTRFYIISGSNMSGKSTLLRAIGLNAVLAFTGAPVCARRLRISRFSVCASLSVVDSLLSGKSKFMAEVDRLRQTLDRASEGQPVLFLIDEIFSGTNSRDRRVAAEAVIRTLMDRGAIGALSTHDLALTEIASAELCGINVHTGSRDGSDPMDFDYRLKPGVTNETSALAIARLAGVPV
jgi:hypothetical protein